MTVRYVTDDIDGLKLLELVGVKTATKAWEPSRNRDVDPAATPLVTGCGPPRGTVPSMNCTVPAAFAGVSIAFSVTRSPSAIAEAGVVVRVVLVSAAPTMKVTGCGELDEAKAVALAGTNIAVSECGPGNNVGVATAIPLSIGTAVPRAADPSMNCTEPAAVAGVTLAVRVTGLLSGADATGFVVSVVLVVVGATASTACGVLRGDKESPTPPTINDAAKITAGAIQAAAARQGKAVRGIMRITSVSDTRVWPRIQRSGQTGHLILSGL